MADEESGHVCARCGAPAEQRCSVCKQSHYCSRECQRADWSAHKPNCAARAPPAAVAVNVANPVQNHGAASAAAASGAAAADLLYQAQNRGAAPAAAADPEVIAVRIRAGGRGKPEAARLRRNGPEWSRGVQSPVLALLGIPIAVAKEKEHPFLQPRADLDNQMTTYFMIDTDSGLAPPIWQSHIGDVHVFRKDGLPLTVEHVWCLWDYFNQLLDNYGNPGGKKKARGWMRRPFFDEWLADYNEVHGCSLQF